MSDAISQSPNANQSAWKASSDRADSEPKSWRNVILAIGLMIAGLVIAVVAGVFDRGPVQPQSPATRAIPAKYEQQRAYQYLNQLCNLGPRPSGSKEMQQQQQILSELFSANGADVQMQTFEIRHPEDGSPVSMANLIAQWHPERPKRFLLCAHYDTRPYPDQDRVNKRGTFIGANDGASGVAALAELSHHLSDLPADVGIDIVLFDGEEFVWQQGRDDYFLGSTFFAEKYKASPPVNPYVAGVLLDMVGDRELKIYFESNSLDFAPTVAREVWKTADRLGVRAFVPRRRHRIEDDHIPLNEIASIPTIDIIDFDYPRPGIGAPSYWHTEQDAPKNCSGESLAAVVWVVHQWLLQQ
ncbi:MAG: M28 family peptidase [Rubripirellula sp.]|nr:M28 family peptidase [Rubripirellula sp.]